MGLFSNRIDKKSLKDGDHIYCWRTAYIYAHHGIYIGNDTVIHFTRFGQEVGTGTMLDHLLVSSLPKGYQACPTCTPPKTGHGVVSSCLNCFLAGHDLYRFEYGVKPAVFIANVRHGTCTTAISDPVDEVIRRANLLLKFGVGSYHVFENNCEHFAIYCKTGLLVLAQGTMGQSGQAESIIHGTCTAVLWATLRLAKISPYGMAASAILYYSTASATRYFADIGVRRDVVKVTVEDLEKMIGISKLEEGITSTTPGSTTTNATATPKDNGEVLMAIESLANILNHHIVGENSNQGATGEELKAIESLAKIVEHLKVGENTNQEVTDEVLKTIESLAKIVEHLKVGENTNQEVTDEVLKTIESLAKIVKHHIVNQGATREVNSALEQLANLEPPAFKGTTEPLEAQSWIAETEKIFEVIGCSDLQKVTFAASMLKEKANDWWKSTKMNLPELVTWESFVEAFNEKYFSSPMRDRKEKEFTNLIQGSMTVHEYDAKFIELSQFAPYMRPYQNAKKFKNGLRSSIKFKLAGYKMDTYSEVLSAALDIEMELHKCKKINDKNKNTKPESTQKGKTHIQAFKKQSPVGSKNKKIMGSGQTSVQGACYRCGQLGHHIKDCLSHKAKGVCYKCGQLGHHIKDCPSR